MQCVHMCMHVVHMHKVRHLKTALYQYKYQYPVSHSCTTKLTTGEDGYMWPQFSLYVLSDDTGVPSSLVASSRIISFSHTAQILSVRVARGNEPLPLVYYIQTKKCSW